MYVKDEVVTENGRFSYVPKHWEWHILNYLLLRKHAQSRVYSERNISKCKWSKNIFHSTVAELKIKKNICGNLFS